ncbi:ExbD/TolR family protein [Scleromatobacter humisilvae]|uniref:Biopolymer transporter ExbD n=1 Tax=Scleromatobacter humisilvae TaxID=2897159 RepID=A0A9X1YK53_9BURK|nr:biopolymer transporter ExbD [Scleromatobacter humisilvae]MCK9687683.1 biopolymer transporter ExbD [Scleromatobacter humisilvae]
MAFGRLERSPTSQPMSDINMTPLIDVMLVLLVIFMIAAPLMTSSLKMDLPKVAAARSNDGGAALALAITPDGKVHVGDAVVTHDVLVSTLRQTAARQPQPDVLLSADKSVPYGRVAELIGLVQDAGLTHIGFTAQPAP